MPQLQVFHGNFGFTSLKSTFRRRHKGKVTETSILLQRASDLKGGEIFEGGNQLLVVSAWISKYLETRLLLISIHFTPKTSHSCLKKMVHWVFQVGIYNRFYYSFEHSSSRFLQGLSLSAWTLEVPVEAVASQVTNLLVLGWFLTEVSCGWHPVTGRRQQVTDFSGVQDPTSLVAILGFFGLVFFRGLFSVLEEKNAFDPKNLTYPHPGLGTWDESMLFLIFSGFPVWWDMLL